MHFHFGFRVEGLGPKVQKQKSGKAARTMASAWPHFGQYMLPQPFMGSTLQSGQVPCNGEESGAFQSLSSFASVGARV